MTEMLVRVTYPIVIDMKHKLHVFLEALLQSLRRLEFSPLSLHSILSQVASKGYRCNLLWLQVNMLCHMVLHKEGCTENNAGQENILQQLYFLYNCKKKKSIY